MFHNLEWYWMKIQPIARGELRVPWRTCAAFLPSKAFWMPNLSNRAVEPWITTKKTHEKCTELFQIDYSKKKNAFYTCSRARTMSKGFVIIVVVKPPSAPAVHWINKWDAFEGKMLIKLSEKETLNVQLIFRMPRAIEPVLLHLDRDDKMSTIKQNSERMPSNWPNSLDSNPWSHPFA